MLRYLVLDELHTYDGAQGADVACLVRRLKERLAIPRGELGVVGTSATLDERRGGTDRQRGPAGAADAGLTGSERLARFASKLFEEEIPVEAVLDEDRLTVEELVRPEAIEVSLPSPDACRAESHETALSYAQRQAPLWGGPEFEPSGRGEEDDPAVVEWGVRLGNWLKGTELFRHVLEVFERAESRASGPLSWNELVEGVARNEFGLGCDSEEDRSLLVSSFFSLIAQARERRSKLVFPLVPTQVQLWIRELRRVGRIVQPEPEFCWLDEPPPNRLGLPVFHCSECGESGWIALHDVAEDARIQARGVNGYRLETEPAKIYRGWFGHKERRSKDIVVISPWTDRDTELAGQQLLPEAHQYLCPAGLAFSGLSPCTDGN